MKSSLLFFAAIVLASCGTKTNAQQENTEFGQETYKFADSTEHVHFDISVTVPAVNDGADDITNNKVNAAQAIRDTLLSVVDGQLAYMGIGDGARLYAPYKGSKHDLNSIMSYNASSAFKAFQDSAEDDYKERLQYLDEDTTIMPDQRQQMMQDTPLWTYEMTLKKIYQDSLVIIYDNEGYCYMGGAHGGIVGYGSMPFRLSDGKFIHHFFKADATKAMQPLIIKGLKEYFSENGEKIKSDAELFDMLQVESNIIPLPIRIPEITSKGLVLTYEQYEIACYAAGMPSFILPITEVKDYLTEDAKTLLNQR